MENNAFLSGREKFFDEDQLIVSKTDLKGRMTYCNKTFLEIAGYKERECLGQPHNLIRHPDMPRCVFKLLWDTLLQKNEIFAYVVNRCKNGDHYWVYAHVTPSLDQSGNIVGYHSNRRLPNRKIIQDVIVPLYAQLREAENMHANRKDGLSASGELLTSMLQEQGVAYDEWVMTIGQGKRRGYRNAGTSETTHSFAAA